MPGGMLLPPMVEASPGRRSLFLKAIDGRTRVDSQADSGSIHQLGGVLTMPGGVKLIDSTLVIVLHNGEQEIERELASPAD